MLEKCSICGSYKLFDTHKCRPSWYVWPADDESFEYIEDNRYYIIFDSDAENAAIQWCEKDSENPETMELFVLGTKEWSEMLNSDLESDELYKLANIKAKKFYMESELVRSWYAHQEI